MQQRPDGQDGGQNGQNDDQGGEGYARPEEVVSNRKGEVLLKFTILKSDHFPGMSAALVPAGNIAFFMDDAALGCEGGMQLDIYGTS